MKRKKLILCFIGAVLLMTGCGGEASLPVYSNLSEEQVREQFETELIQAGAAETDAQKSMAIVKEYNDSIQNTSLVEEGYASFDMTMPEYDIDAIQDLWMKKIRIYRIQLQDHCIRTDERSDHGTGYGRT